MEQEHTTNSHKKGARVQQFLQKKNLLLVMAVAVLGVTTFTAYTLSQQKTELTTKANTSLSIPVVEDSWVDESNTTKGRGTDNQLKVDTDKIAFLKFDLGSLQSQPVQKATLRLYILNGSNTTQNIEEVTNNNWTEAALNYANKPDIGDPLASIANTEKNTWKDIDITTFVNTNKGKVVSLAISALPDDKNNFYIASKETATVPVIMIETIASGGVVATTMVTQPQSPVLTQAPTATQAAPTQKITVAPTSGAIVTVPPTVVPTNSNGTRNISVTNAVELTAALKNAQPGDAITMADGTYALQPYKLNSTSVMVGKQNASAAFRLSKSGTYTQRIVLQGTRKAIIDGNNDYALHIFNANYVDLKGFTVINGSKGIMVDSSNDILIDNVEVRDIAMEGIHLRSFSSNNEIRNSYIHHTGRDKKTGAIDDQYGEGLYVGTANSNWGTYTNGQIDKSDNNKLIGNRIEYTGGEGIDIKEGTSNGQVIGNTFDNAGIAGGFADSWMDIKGNSWTISGNKGINAKKDGYQVHGVWAGWGNNNTFTNNTAANVKDYGFWVQNNVTGNNINCNNTAPGAPAGLANIPCSN